jgi:cephalosporin hydroxylase
MNHIYQDIQGWFDWQTTYSRWAQQVSDGGRIAEIGNYHGRSMAYLLVELANRGRSDVKVIGVDSFVGGDGIPDAPGSIETSFMQNMQRLGEATDRLEHFKMPSTEASSLFLDLTIDFVWIDADHHFSSVLEDLEVWWPKVKLGGEMGGHDLAWQSVRDAVRVWTKAHNLKFEVLPSADPNSGMPSWLIRK